MRRCEKQSAGPSIDRREANTQVIADGETMVIGGVFIDTQNNNVQGVPYLSRIPVLGWLFKNKSESVSKRELLIFRLPPSSKPRECRSPFLGTAADRPRQHSPRHLTRSF
jgi:type II secretory pathway component HofQ